MAPFKDAKNNTRSADDHHIVARDKQLRKPDTLLIRYARGPSKHE